MMSGLDLAFPDTIGITQTPNLLTGDVFLVILALKTVLLVMTKLHAHLATQNSFLKPTVLHVLISLTALFPNISSLKDSQLKMANTSVPNVTTANITQKQILKAKAATPVQMFTPIVSAVESLMKLSHASTAWLVRLCKKMDHAA